jgi:hypothetical protein
MTETGFMDWAESSGHSIPCQTVLPPLQLETSGQGG